MLVCTLSRRVGCLLQRCKALAKKASVMIIRTTRTTRPQHPTPTPSSHSKPIIQNGTCSIPPSKHSIRGRTTCIQRPSWEFSSLHEKYGRSNSDTFLHKKHSGCVIASLPLYSADRVPPTPFLPLCHAEDTRVEAVQKGKLT